MSTTYRMILMDEFDWEYEGMSREIITTKIEQCAPHYKVEASIFGMIIVDIDNESVSHFLAEMRECGVVWDVAYSQRDTVQVLKWVKRSLK